MKFALLASLALLSGLPVQAQQTHYYQTCKGYRETYVPGYVDASGNYVRGHTTLVEYPTQCNYSQNYNYPHPVPPPPQPVPHRRCPVVIGALLGGGTAAAIAKKDSWSWAIPLGAVLGGGVVSSSCN